MAKDNMFLSGPDILYSTIVLMLALLYLVWFTCKIYMSNCIHIDSLRIIRMRMGMRMGMGMRMRMRVKRRIQIRIRMRMRIRIR